LNIQRVKGCRLWCFKISATLLLLCLSVLHSFASDKKDRIIEIACLPHKTFSNPDNTVKIMGAVELRSTDEDFGGISALAMLPDKQKTYLLSDRAYLIVADSVMNPDTLAIECFKNALIRPLRGRSTNPLVGHDADSEGMSVDEDGKKILVSFERHHRVVTYNPREKKLLPHKQYDAFNNKNLPFNESYESVLRLNDKSIIAFPERYEVQENVLTGFRLIPNRQQDSKILQNLHLRRYGGFWLTDIRQLPNGDFITLERSFNIFDGMGLQMRHIKHDDFLLGETADGKIIFKMQSGDGVDNFEGFDIVPQPDGTYMMYVTSDNNFSALQKTLIMSLYYKPE
jgi:hypothetical protein